MPLRQIYPGSDEYRQMLQLRKEVLPRYKRMAINAEEMEKDTNDTLIAAFDENKMLGCCILSKLNNDTAILRDMAVTGKFQGMGVGASLLNYAENIALAKGLVRVNLECPESALTFYEKAGYKPTGKKYMDGGIYHHPIEKILK